MKERAMPNQGLSEKKLLGQAKPRIWEIDFLRGLSIILMVFYHFGYDLTDLCGIRRPLGIGFNPSSSVMLALQSFFAGVFIVLSGISSTLSRGNVRRALKLLAVALLVTLATYIFDPRSTIHFGILHCLGVSILLYGLAFERSKPLACGAAGLLVIGLRTILSLELKRVSIGFDWLLPFGITSPTYSSYDYFPLIPWFGVFLLGAALGKSVYAGRQSLLRIKLPENFINFAGRHSLLIYIVHQPILIGVLYVLGLMHR